MYCRHCGKKCEWVGEERLHSYDKRTGEPIYENNLKCPDYHWLWGLFHVNVWLKIRGE